MVNETVFLLRGKESIHCLNAHIFCLVLLLRSEILLDLVLDVARCYLWLFTLSINIKIGKNGC